jgi:hypothetical protein
MLAILPNDIIGRSAERATEKASKKLKWKA